MKNFSILVALILLSFHARSQQLEEVVVTASFVGGEYYEIPSVTLKKKADFLVQNIQLINDSRSPDRRKEEILESIDNFISASKKIPGVELSYGQGFLAPIKLNDDSLQIIEDRKRIDTSYVNIFVKVALNVHRSSKQQIAELRSFIMKAKLKGRTETLLLGDIGLSIVGPEQYRYEIFKKIAEENEKVRSIVGNGCEITIGGLAGRVEWERSDIETLTLYIPYSMEATCQ